LLFERSDSLEEVDVEDDILDMLQVTDNLKEVPEKVSCCAAVLLSRVLLDFFLVRGT